MTIKVADVCLIAIAVGVWVAVLFGLDITS